MVRSLFIMKDSKDSKLGKGYSIFFALVICGLMIAQALRIELSYVDQILKVKLSFVEVPLSLLLAEVSLIAYLLGAPTDGLAAKIAEILDHKDKDKE